MAAWYDQITKLPIKRPSSTAPFSNGEIPLSVLVEVEEWGQPDAVKDGPKLIEPVAKAWLAMKNHAWNDGIIINVSSPADAYRTYAQQVTTFRFRYVDTGIPTTEPRPTSDSKRWDGDENRPATWWDKHNNVADAAVPGTSNHGWACAVDVASAGVPARLAWLEAWARHYGFMWENRTENWHLTYVEGDALPPAFQPVNPPIPSEDDEMRIITLTDKADASFLLTGQMASWLDPARYNGYIFLNGIQPERYLASQVTSNWVLTGTIPPGLTKNDFWKVLAQS